MSSSTLAYTVCIAVCLVWSEELDDMFNPVLSCTICILVCLVLSGKPRSLFNPVLHSFYCVTVCIIWCKQMACLTGSYTDCFVNVNLMHRKGTFNLMHSKGFSPVLHTLYGMVWYDMSSFGHFEIMLSNRRRMSWLISNAQNCRQAVPGSKPTFQKPRTD
jgi:hypothetical protein